MGHAKRPALLIIRSSIGDEVGLVGQRVKMLFEFAQRNSLSHRHAIAHDVQIGPGKVYDFFSMLVFYVRIANVPFTRNGPVEDLGPRRHFMDLQSDVLAKLIQRISHPVTGDAAANRVYLSGKSEDLIADVVANEPPPTKSFDIHDVCLHQQSPDSGAGTAM